MEASAKVVWCCVRNSEHLSTPLGVLGIRRLLHAWQHGNQRSSTLDNREASKAICSLVAKLLGGLACDWYEIWLYFEECTKWVEILVTVWHDATYLNQSTMRFNMNMTFEIWYNYVWKTQTVHNMISSHLDVFGLPPWLNLCNGHVESRTSTLSSNSWQLWLMQTERTVSFLVSSVCMHHETKGLEHSFFRPRVGLNYHII